MSYTTQDLQIILEYAARRDNMLCLTSRCGEHSVFRSVPLPPGVDIPDGGERPMEEIRRSIALLTKGRPITLGAPWPQVWGGDPLSHPHFQEILAEVRLAFPTALVRIVTDGGALTPQCARFLSQHGPVQLELVVSAGPQGPGGEERAAAAAMLAMALLVQFALPFSATAIAPPLPEGTECAEAAVRLLARYGAAAVRLVPGGALVWRDHPWYNPDPASLEELADRLAPQLPCPLLVEPSGGGDLSPVVLGVLQGSPAWEAGVRRGDVLLTVNGHAAASAPQAGELVNRRREVKVKYDRGGRLYTAHWDNGPQGAGLAFAPGYDPRRLALLRHALDSEGPALVMVPRREAPLLSAALEGAGEPGCTLLPVEAAALGGPLSGAQLLCCRDYLTALRGYLADHQAPERVLLPAESFNGLGWDLQGVGVAHLERLAGVPLQVL